MKKFLIFIFISIIFSVSIFAAKWTFMVYLDGDNNLESAGIDDVNEMEKIGSTRDVNIIVLFDRAERYDASNGNWTTAKIARIRRDRNSRKMSSFDSSSEDWGEVNMGSRETLKRFIEYSIQKYPAEKYALILWNHGGGWRSLRQMEQASRGIPVSDPNFRYDQVEHIRLKMRMERKLTIANSRSICSDDSHNGQSLYTKDLRLVLEEIPVKMNLIGMDACVMGMIEVAYELRNHGDVITFSEENEPNAGWPYDLLLPHLIRKPEMDAEKLGKIIVDSYRKYYDHYGGRNPPTQSAIRLSEMNNIKKQLNLFIQNSTQRQVSDSIFLEIRKKMPLFGVTPGNKTDYIDFKNFFSQINIKGKYKTKKIINALDRAVIRNYSYKKGLAEGLSIYFPLDKRGEFNEYNEDNILFARDTQWDEFITYLQGETIIPPTPNNGKISLIANKFIVVKDKDSDTPAEVINPGDTIYLKTYYSVSEVPTSYKELIVWGMFDPKGNYLKDLERLQVEESKKGSWIITNRIKIPQDYIRGKYYAVCDISILSPDSEKKANKKKIGIVPIGIDKSLRSAPPRINKNAYQMGNELLVNQGKLLITNAPYSDFNVKIAVNRRGHLPEYKINDKFKLGIKTSKDAYIAILIKQSSGKFQLIYPNESTPSISLRADKIVFFPPKGKGSIRVIPPAGRETVKVIASTIPITLNSLNQYFLTGKIPFGYEWAEASLSYIIKDVAGPILSKIVNNRGGFQKSFSQNGIIDIYNLRSDRSFFIDIALNIRGRIPVFKAGYSDLKIGIKTGENSYITILQKNALGQYNILLSGKQFNNFATKDNVFFFPPKNQGTLKVGPPVGFSEIKVIATKEKIDWNNLTSVYQYLLSYPNRWSEAIKLYKVK